MRTGASCQPRPRSRVPGPELRAAPMRRRRWPATRAASLCLAVVVVLQLSVDGAAAAGKPSSTRRALRHASHTRLPPSSSSPSLPVAPHDVARAKVRGRAVAFDVAAAVGARCNSSTPEAAGGRGAACVDDDDKRVVPTGPNPLHNR